MDFDTKFLYNQQGEIYAIQPLMDAGGVVFKDKATVKMVATSATAVDAMGIVRQLNFRKELYEAVAGQSRKLSTRLFKAHRTNLKLRRELRKLKAGK